MFMKLSNNLSCYLGEVLHEGGLTKSVEATVAKRYGRILTNIIEVSFILEDFRIDTIEGLKSGLDIFEMAILPSLLNNADVWIFINEQTVNRLENLQNMMYRQLFAVPNSTPTPMLRLDLGSLNMKERIHQKKLNFLHHLKSLESESLAAEIYDLQARYDFPGLVSECRELIAFYALPNIIDSHGQKAVSQQTWKRLVKKAIKDKSEEVIKSSFKSYSKLKNKNYESENFEIKPYITEMRLREARTLFRVRSSMIPAKMNMKSNPNYAQELWKCDDCMSMDSQSHILWCPAYAPLREGKTLSNDLDLVHYFQAVIKIREDNST